MSILLHCGNSKTISYFKTLPNTILRELLRREGFIMEERKSHEITLKARELLDVTGITNVEKFTDDDVILETDMGLLGIKGEKMHMKKLDLDGGTIIIEGLIKSLSYSKSTDPTEKSKSIFERLFK